MLNNNKQIIKGLVSLNLTDEEARIYIELLKEPHTHLRLSRVTGINRTKVYRIIEQLEKRSLVTHRSDDRGTFLVAQDHSSLEIELMTQEEKNKQQRLTLQTLIPQLELLKKPDGSKFTVHTYEGIEGYKQMIWHELKTKGELLVLGNVTLEELVENRRWSEKIRTFTVEKGYKIRELINRPYEDPTFFEDHEFIKNVYSSRTISSKDLPIDTPIIVYNDTVAIYQMKPNKKVGVEIVNKMFANTMRYMFEHYWTIAKD